MVPVCVYEYLSVSVCLSLRRIVEQSTSSTASYMLCARYTRYYNTFFISHAKSNGSPAAAAAFAVVVAAEAADLLWLS